MLALLLFNGGTAAPAPQPPEPPPVVVQATGAPPGWTPYEEFVDVHDDDIIAMVHVFTGVISGH